MALSPSIYIDESGDPGLNNSRVRYYTVAYLYTLDPAFLRRKLVNYLIHVQDKDEYPLTLKEFKFFLPKNKLREDGYDKEQIRTIHDIQMPEIRRRILQMVDKYSHGTFIALLDKESRAYKTWTEENIGNYVIGNTLVRYILDIPSIIVSPSIHYDEGRLSLKQTIAFENYLEFKYADLGLFSKFGCPLKYSRLNSLLEPLIWAADIVAGAHYYEFVYNDTSYSRLLTKKIGIGFKKYW